MNKKSMTVNKCIVYVSIILCMELLHVIGYCIKLLVNKNNHTLIIIIMRKLIVACTGHVQIELLKTIINLFTPLIFI